MLLEQMDIKVIQTQLQHLEVTIRSLTIMCINNNVIDTNNAIIYVFTKKAS